VGPGTSLDVVARVKNPSPLPGFEHSPATVSPISGYIQKNYKPVCVYIEQ